MSSMELFFLMDLNNSVKGHLIKSSSLGFITGYINVIERREIETLEFKSGLLWLSTMYYQYK